MGLTGGIGSGKSEVTKRLAALGAVVTDADVLSREVVAPGTPGLAEIVEAFGPEMLAADGSLDRPRLGQVVFADDTARQRLEAIVHPKVRARRNELVAAAPADAIVVDDVPLLVEADLAGGYDVVVVVDAPDEVRLQRLVGHRGMTEADARARLDAQAPREERLAVADLVVTNDTDLDTLDERVRRLWAELTARAQA
ncbi:MAG: dephospho-CoA kinase [Streptosporangiales bacterium]|nr:dephospho-CoA kinase [Streptosporangiales bacterium]